MHSGVFERYERVVVRCPEPWPSPAQRCDADRFIPWHETNHRRVAFGVTHLRAIKRGMKKAPNDQRVISLNSSRRIMDVFKVLVRLKAQSDGGGARLAARFAEQL